MAKVTSKLQVTIPKAIADRHGIRPGQEIEFRDEPGGVLRVIATPAAFEETRVPVAERLALFDGATRRLRRLTRELASGAKAERGWTRAELYERGRDR